MRTNGWYMTDTKFLSYFFVTICLVILVVQPVNAGWQQTFNEDFNESALDTAKWNTKYQWGDTIINNELQYYASDAFEFGTKVPGSLSIRADQRRMNNQNYTSGSITTAGKFVQLYGYFEMRAQLPKGRGLWPAFWMDPADDSWPPEIDILEYIGQEPTRSYFTYHWAEDGVHKKIGSSYDGEDLSNGFHTFGVDWQPGLLVWYVDGKERFRVQAASVPSKAMYLIANLAVGGDFPGSPDPSTVFPAYMNIDYIRAYRRVNDGVSDTLPPGAVPPATPPTTEQWTFASSGSVSPANVSSGQRTTVRSDVNSPTGATSAVITYFFYAPSGELITSRSFTGQTFAPGETKSFEFEQLINAGYALGTYQVKVGIYNFDWTQTYYWNNSLASFNVIAPVSVSPQFSAIGSVSAPRIYVGQSQTINASVKSLTGASNVVVRVFVYNSQNQLVSTQTFEGQYFAAGETKSYSMAYLVPTGSIRGTYKVRLGAYNSDWSKSYYWSDNLASFNVK